MKIIGSNGWSVTDASPTLSTPTGPLVCLGLDMLGFDIKEF